MIVTQEFKSGYLKSGKMSSEEIHNAKARRFLIGNFSVVSVT